MIKLATNRWLSERCYRPVDSDCLIWRGQVDRTGSPISWTSGAQGQKRRKLSVRKNAWEIKNGPVPEGHVVTSSCGNSRCIQHLELITQAEVVRRQWERAEVAKKRTASTTEASRRRGKLDMQKAREIRNSSETLKDISERMGISMTIASLVRRGLAWKEPHPWGGLFAGLAANDGKKKAA